MNWSVLAVPAPANAPRKAPAGPVYIVLRTSPLWPNCQPVSVTLAACA